MSKESRNLVENVAMALRNTQKYWDCRIEPEDYAVHIGILSEYEFEEICGFQVYRGKLFNSYGVGVSLIAKKHGPHTYRIINTFDEWMMLGELEE